MGSFRLAWATDVHLDHAGADAVAAFYAQVKAAAPDALLVTGDISNSHSLPDHLRAVSESVGVPLYYVLGNHDYYGGSVEMVRRYMAGFHTENHAFPVLWLNASGPVRLGDRTALVGDDGWYDGRNGNFFRSDVELNDFRVIRELATPNRQVRLARIKALADASADRVELLIAEAAALPGVERVIVATHVAPWEGAAWHMGRPSDKDWQPFFSSRAMGVAVDRAAAACGKEVMVLCGHSHSPGVHSPSDLVTCRTGAAQYGCPSLCGTFEL